MLYVHYFNKNHDAWNMNNIWSWCGFRILWIWWKVKWSRDDFSVGEKAKEVSVWTGTNISKMKRWAELNICHIHSLEIKSTNSGNGNKSKIRLFFSQLSDECNCWLYCTVNDWIAEAFYQYFNGVFQKCTLVKIHPWILQTFQPQGLDSMKICESSLCMNQKILILH